MKHGLFLQHVIRPGLAVLSDATARPMAAPEAEVLLLAIAIQESALRHRQQLGGPARGWWQFERSGGLAGVMGHARTRGPCEALCGSLNLRYDQGTLWDALPHSELLQVGLARLLLYSDNAGLPAIGLKEPAWQYYLRNWRPGKPGRERWDAAYDGAVELVRIDAPPVLTRATEALRALQHAEAALAELRRSIA